MLIPLTFRHVLRSLFVMLALSATLAQTAHAFGPVPVNKDLKQFPLQAAELAKVSITAGWVDGEPTRMVFDIGNRLTQPIFCANVELDLVGRGKEVRTLSPALYVPPTQSRRGRLADLTRKDVRSFNVACTCLRKADKGPCEHPLAQ